MEFEQLCIGMHLHGAALAGERYQDLARRAEPVDPELAVLALLQALTEDLLAGWTRRARVAGERLRALVAEPATAPALVRGARSSWGLFICFDGTAEERRDAERDALAMVAELLDERDGLADGCPRSCRSSTRCCTSTRCSSPSGSCAPPARWPATSATSSSAVPTS